MKKIINHLIKMFNQNHFEECHLYILFEDVENTNNPNKYSEGLFAWSEDGSLKTSLEFHEENGGDPVVFKKYILRNSF